MIIPGLQETGMKTITMKLNGLRINSMKILNRTRRENFALTLYYASSNSIDPDHWFCKTRNGCIVLQRPPSH